MNIFADSTLVIKLVVLQLLDHQRLHSSVSFKHSVKYRWSKPLVCLRAIKSGNRTNYIHTSRNTFTINIISYIYVLGFFWLPNSEKQAWLLCASYTLLRNTLYLHWLEFLLPLACRQKEINSDRWRHTAEYLPSLLVHRREVWFSLFHEQYII
jgi:hypothetical protein